MNIAAAFKEEVLRVSKKVVRKEVDSFRTQLALQRKQIAQLKKELSEQRKLIRTLNKTKQERPKLEAPTKTRRPRFSTELVKQRRAKLGLTQAEFAKLLGVSGLTIYNLEKGGEPRQKTLAAFGATATLSKREAKAKLQAIESAA